jgi:hypothetical protein
VVTTKTKGNEVNKMKFNDEWRYTIDNDIYIRLCECRNTKNDIFIMAKEMWKFNPNKKFEDCLDRMIEWVLDWNNQYDDFEITKDDCDKWIKKVKEV